MVLLAALARWPEKDPPIEIPVRVVVVYYHEGATIRLDGDNMLNSILDAMNGHMYLDDRLVVGARASKIPVDAPYRVRRMSHLSPTLSFVVMNLSMFASRRRLPPSSCHDPHDAVREHRKVREVAREYRRAGYEVLVGPTGTQVPAFLGHHHPDLIGIGDRESVVIEVRSARGFDRSEENRDIAAESPKRRDGALSW
jgi:hypothetical protein